MSRTEPRASRIHPGRPRRRSPTSPSAPGSRARPSPTRSTTPTCCAPTPSSGSGRRSTSSATRPTAPPATCAPAAPQLIGLRVPPAQEGTANALMDRFVHSLVETSAEAGLPRAALRRRRRRPGRRLRRPAPLDGGRRLRRHRHLPRQPAGRLARPSSGRRSSRSAGRGTSPHATPPVGRRRRRRRHPARHRPPHRARATRGSPGSAGARTPRSARTGAPAGSSTMRERGLATTGLASPGRGHRPERRRGGRACCSTSALPPRSSAPPTPSRWACCTPCGPPARARPRHRGGRLRRLPGRAGLPVGLTSVRQPLEEVAVEIVARSRACSPTCRPPAHGVLLTPTLAVRESS